MYDDVREERREREMETVCTGQRVAERLSSPDGDALHLRLRMPVPRLDGSDKGGSWPANKTLGF